MMIIVHQMESLSPLDAAKSSLTETVHPQGSQKYF